MVANSFRFRVLSEYDMSDSVGTAEVEGGTMKGG